MDRRAKGRLALVAAPVVFVMFLATPIQACDATLGCPSNASNLDGVAANALPTYPDPAPAEQAAAEPVKLKKFTKAHVRAARPAQPRRARLAQRARAGTYASARKATQVLQERTNPAAKIAPSLANAKAEFMDVNAAKALLPDVKAWVPKTPRPTDVSAQSQQTDAQADQPRQVELVAADAFNDLDKLAWEANQMPRLMQLRDNGSHAELRDDDSRWAQTSTIGKVFVALGAMLTLASAARMFMA